MALIQIPNLPPVVSLANSAEFECVQAGASYRTTVAQILANAVPYPFPGWYGSFYSTAIQTNAGATTANAVTLNQSRSALGATVGSNSHVIIGAPGVYNVQVTLIADKTDAGTSLIDVWLSKNGTNIAYTNHQVSVTGSYLKYTISFNELVSIDAANDYIEVYWSSADLAVRLFAQGTQNNPSRPGEPSAAVSVNLVCDTSAQSLQPASNPAILSYLDSLPTANPGVSGALWWNAGVLTKV